MPSYSHHKNTQHTINVLGNHEYSEGYWMATTDVTSPIHNNTPQVGLSAVEYLFNQVSHIPLHQRDFIMDPPKFAFTHNYFWSGGQNFLQNKGVAMGAIYASSLANLFMAKSEGDVIYAHCRPELVLWVRCIDDILLLWDGSLDSLDGYM